LCEYNINAYGMSALSYRNMTSLRFGLCLKC